MEIALYLLLAAFLLFLNAFFVLAEFAAVKIRPTRVEELIGRGVAKARVVRHIQENIDEYLSACQLGITFASVGLGFVGEKSVARLLEPVVAWTGAASTAVAHGIAVTAAYILVSSLHILIGEQVPKMVGIRRAERAALWTSLPLRFFRTVFYLPLRALSVSTNAVLRSFGVTGAAGDAHHSEEELRMLLSESQNKGLLSFRSLLLLENVFDLGGVKVREAMRPRESVKVLRTTAAWEENHRTIRETKFSRYPVMTEGADRPAGILHVKDLLHLGPEKMASADLKALARPYVTVGEETLLEDLLSDLQKRHSHLAIVLDAQSRWTGFVTLEDIVEEIIGTVEDEFEAEPPLFLSDALTPGRIVLGVEAASIPEAIRSALYRVSSGDLPADREQLTTLVLEREKAMSTYLGRGLAVPHARLERLERPALIFARSGSGVPVQGRDERAHLFFLLLTPLHAPKMQARLLARIGGLLSNETVADRLREASDPGEVLEAIRAGEHQF